MTEIRKADKDLLELIHQVVTQNGEVIEMNKVFIKLFASPTFVVNQSYRGPGKEKDNAK